MKKPFVFLGGTCGHNNWRKPFIANLIARGVPTEALFNPVVPPGTWSKEDRVREAEAKKKATCQFFFLGDPREPERQNRMSGYSLFEATMALHGFDGLVVIVFDLDDQGLVEHARKGYQEAHDILRRSFPAACIFRSLAPAEELLVSEFAGQAVAD